MFGEHNYSEEHRLRTTAVGRASVNVFLVIYFVLPLFALPCLLPQGMLLECPCDFHYRSCLAMFITRLREL